MRGPFVCPDGGPENGAMPPRSRKTPTAKLTELDIRKVPIGTLKPDPDNARTHGPANLAAIKASLQEFGQRKPLCVAADFTVVAGNGTLACLIELDVVEVWVSVFPGTAAEARAFGIADNRTGELAEWNEPNLTSALQTFDDRLLAATGFTPDDVEARLTAMGQGPQLGDMPAVDFHGQQATIGLKAQGDLYEAKGTRTLYFDYPQAVYEWITGKLRDYQIEHHLAGNAEAIIGMMEEVSQQTAPGGGTA